MKFFQSKQRCSWSNQLVTAAALFALAFSAIAASALAACTPANTAMVDQSGAPTPTNPVEPSSTEPPNFDKEAGSAIETSTEAVSGLIEKTAQPLPEIIKNPGPAPLIVVSFDGAPYVQVQNWMNDGILPAFSSLAEQGIPGVAGRLMPLKTVNPSLTAPAHASLVTGHYPSQTGIVSNLYHNPADSIYWYRSGFSQPLDGVEPAWVSVSNAGYLTAALFIAGGTPFLPGQTADLTIAYGTRLAYSNLESLKLETLTTEWEGDIPISFSPPLEGSWIVPKVAQVYVYAVDSMDDNIVAYDTVLLNRVRVMDEAAAQLQKGKWGALEIDPTKKAGAHFLLQSISNTNGGVTLEIYYTGVYHNMASPRTLQVALDEQFGFFPAPADAYALEHGWITAEQFLVMLERSTRWMAEVTAWVYQSYHPDLTFTWLDPFDTAGHAFYPRPPESAGYDPDIDLMNAQYYQRAAVIADQALAALTQAIPPSETTFLLVSDHGMAPVHTMVNLNTLLEDAGWLILDERDYVVSNQTQAIAFASGGSANVYINLAGREKDGIVPEEEYLSLRSAIIEALQSLRDPETGEAIFARILVREDLAALHLDNLHTGDIFIQANPGFNLDSHRGYKGVFQPTSFNGQHGYDASIEAMQGVFLAAGAGIPPAEVIISNLHITDIVPTIYTLLDIPLPDHLPGISAFSTIQPP